MIRLKFVPKPSELTDALSAELTTRFKAEQASVWKQAFIISALLEMGRRKCAFCECRLVEESKDLHVEHFHPKSIYPDKVVDWENLLPSCKRCNDQKKAHDVAISPIINPRFEDPNQHLFWKAGRLGGKTDLGRNTVGVVKLNDPDRLVDKRNSIASSIEERLATEHKRVTECLGNPLEDSILKRAAYTIQNLLAEATPEQNYAATAATVILHNIEFQQVRSILVQNNYWSRELDAAEQVAQLNRLEYR